MEFFIMLIVCQLRHNCIAYIPTCIFHIMLISASNKNLIFKIQLEIYLRHDNKGLTLFLRNFLQFPELQYLFFSLGDYSNRLCALFHAHTTQSIVQTVTYYRRKKFLCPWFKRRLKLKYSFCIQFHEYSRFNSVRSTKKSSLHDDKFVFTM